MQIYKATHIDSGKVYIGRTKDMRRRYGEHTAPSARLKLGQAIRIHGIDRFKFEVIETLPTYAEAVEREAYWIAKFQNAGLSVYNMNLAGVIPSDEQLVEMIAKMKVIQCGKPRRALNRRRKICSYTEPFSEGLVNYHYTESGLDQIWLESGFTLEDHPNYGPLISIWNVHDLHRAIGRWLIGQPRGLTGAEFRFLRTEMDSSQRRLGQLLGVTEQAIAKWEKASRKSVVNKAAERLLRVYYSDYIGGSNEFASVLDRIAQLDAEMAEKELHLEKGAEGSWAKAA